MRGSRANQGSTGPIEIHPLDSEDAAVTATFRASWIHLNGYKEVDVRNRAQGFSVTLRLSKGIPGLPP
jgi:hypothetical protein